MAPQGHTEHAINERKGFYWALSFISRVGMAQGIVSRLGWNQGSNTCVSGTQNGGMLIGPWVGELEKKNLSDVQCNFSISFIGITADGGFFSRYVI